jgi:hypothetical protein
VNELIECIVEGVNEWKRVLMKQKQQNSIAVKNAMAFNEEVASHMDMASSIPSLASSSSSLSRTGSASNTSFSSSDVAGGEMDDWLLNVTELEPFPEEATQAEKAELGIRPITRKVLIYVDKYRKVRIPAVALAKSKKGRTLLKRAQRERKKKQITGTATHTSSPVVFSPVANAQLGLAADALALREKVNNSHVAKVTN